MPETATVDTSSNFGQAMAGSLAAQVPGALAESKNLDTQREQMAKDTVSRLNADEGKKALLERPPIPPPVKAPEFQGSSPAEAWGSMAMAGAMLASAFTRQPLVNALNAGAGVMNAYKKRDLDAYKTNFAQWKAETDYATRAYEYQRDAYKDAMDLIGSDQKNALAQLRVLSAALKDDPLHRLAEAGNIAGIVTLQTQRDDAHKRSIVETGRLTQEGQTIQELMEAGRDVRSAQQAAQANPNDLGAQQAFAEAQQRYQTAQQGAKDLHMAKTGGGSAADQRLSEENDLYSKLRKEWETNNPGKEISPTIEAELRAKAHGSLAGRAETQTQARERELNAAVEGDIRKFREQNPEATSSQLDAARWDSRIRHEQELGGAVRQPRSAPAMALEQFVSEYTKEHGKRPSAAEIQTFQATGAEKTAEGRSVGTRSANLEMASNVADALIPLVKATSDKIDRTEFPNVNSVILAFQKGTGNPDVVRYGEMMNSLRYAYARALSPTGAARVADLTRLDGILDPNWTKGQIDAALDQIHQTINIEKGAISKTREELRSGGLPPPSANMPSATTHKFSASDAKGQKLYSDDGVKWFTPDGKPYGQ